MFAGWDFDMLLIGLAALIAISFHEMSHGLMAYKLGDPTAKYMGRLTLNPIKHIDIFGLLMILFVGFGWAKPVPVNPRYFKNAKTGMAITALAGPVSNLTIAFFALLIGGAVISIMPAANHMVLNFLFLLANINIGLGIFNLIPIPPLDGSKIMYMFLPDEFYNNVLKYERFGMFILMAVLWMGYLTPYLSVARNFTFDLFLSIVASIFF